LLHPNRLVPPAPAGWLTLVVIRWRLLVVLASLAAVAPVATDRYLPGLQLEEVFHLEDQLAALESESGS
jgi:hypothetical protein